MSDVEIGKLVDSDQQRDAIHVAVFPAMAGTKHRPGDHVYCDENGVTWPSVNSSSTGVVDPFLTSVVEEGQRFWLFLKPNTVTGMRHHWQHPGFPDEPSVASIGTKEESEEWLRDFVESNDTPNYEVLIAAALGEDISGFDEYGDLYSRNDGEYLFFGNTDAHGDIPPAFWDHVENVTGKKCPIRAKYFSCSC